jgi:O-antigen ligase
VARAEKLDKFIYWSLCGYALAFSVSVAAANVFFALAIVLGLARAIQKRPVVSIPLAYFRAMAVFLAVLACLLLVCPDFMAGIKRIWHFTDRIVMFILVAAFIKDKGQIVRLLGLMFISILINDIYAIWQGLHGNYRASGFGGHVIELAGTLVQLIPIMVIALMDKTFKKYRAFLYTVLLISTPALMFNGTRGVWLALLVVLPTAALMYYGNINRVLAYFVLVTLILGAVVVSVPALEARVASIPNPYHENNKERVLIWHSAWQMFMDHPITGVGLDQYTKKYQTEYISPAARERTLTHAHNNFLQMLAENGLVGFLAFCFMFGSFIYYSLQDWLLYRQTSMLMLLAITAGILIEGLTDFNFGLTKMMRLYFGLMALCLQYRYINKIE